MVQNKTQQFEYKEIQLSLAIHDNDIRHKAKNAVKLLKKVYKNTQTPRYKIHLVIRLRGRHQTHADQIPALFEKFILFCKKGAEQEGPLQHKPGSDTWYVLLRQPNMVN